MCTPYLTLHLARCAFLLPVSYNYHLGSYLLRPFACEVHDVGRKAAFRCSEGCLQVITGTIEQAHSLTGPAGRRVGGWPSWLVLVLV